MSERPTQAEIDYSKMAEGIADTIKHCTTPLNEFQFMAMAGALAVYVEQVITQLKEERLNLTCVSSSLRTQISNQRIELSATKDKMVLLVDAVSDVLKDELTGEYFVESDWEPLYWKMYLALSASSTEVAKYLAEIRAKALEDAIDICQDQQGNEENDDFAQGYEAGCKECEEGIKHLANELRASASQPTIESDLDHAQRIR